MTLLFLGGIGLAVPAIAFGLAFLITAGLWERRFKRAGYGPDKNGGYLPWYTITGMVTGVLAGIFLGAIVVAENVINPVWWVAIAVLGTITITSFIVSLFKSRKKKDVKVGMTRKVKWFGMAFLAGLLISIPFPKKQKHNVQDTPKEVRA